MQTKANTDPPLRLLTVEQVATQLGVNIRHVRRLVQERYRRPRPRHVGGDAEHGIRVEGFRPVTPVPARWTLAEIARLAEQHPLLNAGFYERDPAKLVEAVESSVSALGDQAARADHGLLPSGGGVLPSGLHYPGSFSDDPDVVFFAT